MELSLAQRIERSVEGIATTEAEIASARAEAVGLLVTTWCRAGAPIPQAVKLAEEGLARADDLIRQHVTGRQNVARSMRVIVRGFAEFIERTAERGAR